MTATPGRSRGGVPEGTPPARRVGSAVDALRTAATVVSGVLATIVVASSVWAVGLVRPYAPVVDVLIRGWARAWLVPAGVRVRVEGLDRIPAGEPLVVVSNHTSNFDIVVHLAALPLRLRFLAKRELFRIPLFGPAMRRVGMVEVDRAGVSWSAISAQAREALGAGVSVMVYPEGTRSRDGSLGPFLRGGFVLARDAGCRLLPIALVGSGTVMAPDRLRVRAGEVRLLVGDPIPVAGRKTTELRDEARAAVEALLAAG